MTVSKWQLFIDPSDIADTPGGFIQVVFLIAAYAYILFVGSNMIADGSELLLLVPALAGIVGSVVLPVLGAVPDGAIVLFSGMGPKAEAQVQLSVGVGALAGSTIMLLTIPWILAVIAGRVNLQSDGQGTYKKPKGAASDWSKLSPPGFFSLTQTGVNCNAAVKVSAYAMLITTGAFLFIQGAASADKCSKVGDKNCEPGKEKWWAFVGLIYCIIAFIGYLYFQVRQSNSESRTNQIDMTRQKAVERGLLSISGAFANELLDSSTPGETTRLTGADKNKSLTKTLRAFFNRYDRNADGTIDKFELASLMNDLGEKLNPDELSELMRQLDSDNNGVIDFDEFNDGIVGLIQTRSDPTLRRSSIQSAGYDIEAAKASEAAGADDDDDDESESSEEEVPEDLADLTPEQQQRRIKMRSAYLMFLGTALVLLFSDPMVDCLASLGDRMGVSPFYVSFVLAPLASNASELLASYQYALKKTKKSITISFSALEGAACMNNTFCLGIFLALVFFRGLVWEFTAETIAIFVVQLLMFFMCLKTTHRVLDAFIVLTLYPLSIALVAILEAAGLN